MRQRAFVEGGGKVHVTSVGHAVAGLKSAPQGRAEPVAGPRSAGRRYWPSAAQLLFALTVVMLYCGYHFETEQYLTPRRGLGYAFGIVGGSSMLLLLVYPLRKRVPALKFIGTTKRWFQAHMALGVIGPVLVLFHSNFSFGATNSNVALLCMLVVSGSGLFGRYFYTHIHHGLHGRKATLAELKEYANRLRWVTSSVAFLPDLVNRLDAEEQMLIQRSERAFLLARPAVGSLGVFMARRRLRRYVVSALEDPNLRQTAMSGHPHKLREAATAYIDSRLNATRRVLEFGAFERLFSLWHALHLPLFLMLLIAGTVHVFAVHLY
jgi:hypothetical protein